MTAFTEFQDVGLVTRGAMAMHERFSGIEKRSTGWAHRGALGA